MSWKDRRLPPFPRMSIAGILFIPFCVLALIFAIKFGLLPYPHPGSNTPECLKSEYIRVQIGEHKYALPRQPYTTISGQDVKQILHPESGSSSAIDACQEASDPIWQIDEMSLDLYPEHCNSRSNCDGAEFMLWVKRDGFSALITSYEELKKNCYPPHQPFNEFHKRVWSACRLNFSHGGTEIRLLFRGGIYPPEDMEKTKSHVLALLKQYEMQ